MRTTDKISNCGGSFKRLDETTIKEEVRQRAEEELGETDEKRLTCLTELRVLLKGERDLDANTSDDFLLQFLRAKKFNTKKTFVTLKKYYNHRILYPSIYQNFSPGQTLKALRANIQNFWILRTSDDCAIWVARIGSWDPSEIDYETILKFGFLCHEKELQNPITQISGVVSIVDLKGFSWRHLLNMPSSMTKCFISASQDCLPIRHKAIHVINNPSIFGLLFDIIKPFVTNKILKRIHFHGYNMSSLHQYIPPCILPEEFGGTQGSFQNEQFYTSLIDSEEQFLENQKYGYKVKHL